MWLMLGGDKCRPIGNCTAQIITAFMEFLQVAVRGSGVRFECAVSGNNSCAVLSLMATYGTRMTEFCLAEGLLVCSTKYWSYHVNSLILDTLSRLVDLVEGLQTANFHNRLLASVYDAGLMLRFLAFGKSRLNKTDINSITVQLVDQNNNPIDNFNETLTVVLHIKRHGSDH
ncbi:uncharacterized protein LOC100573815 [Acyrthosiphon pisum]|uniref:Uncharacterized protein n=1 Tax=Acyrthosiphon pisum TaxID=7029 RepID=A0A8R2NLK7_ACYPI|nr:uncharacterized protein LOC100573815 [Acyrthosiphon pisum]